MGLFDKRIAYKPFEYPEYYTEGWLKQAQAFWLHTEISMQSDIKDWNEKLDDKERDALHEDTARHLRQAGAHYIIRHVSELPSLLVKM